MQNDSNNESKHDHAAMMMAAFSKLPGMIVGKMIEDITQDLQYGLKLIQDVETPGDFERYPECDKRAIRLVTVVLAGSDIHADGRKEVATLRETIATQAKALRNAHDQVRQIGDQLGLTNGASLAEIQAAINELAKDAAITRALRANVQKNQN